MITNGIGLHSYDYKRNWTALRTITIINRFFKNVTGTGDLAKSEKLVSLIR